MHRTVILPVMNDVEMRGDRDSLRKTAAGRAILQKRLELKGHAGTIKDKVRAYDNRPFIAWDGEGGESGSGRHSYFLFGNSIGDSVQAPELGTWECLNLLWQTEVANPDSFHVIFAGKYDVNMILKDCHYVVLERLHSTGRTSWGGFKLTYAPGKYFRVTKDKVTCTLFDVWAFFGCSFVKACREYLGDHPDFDAIEEGKGKRKTFQYSEIVYIREYWQRELHHLVALMDKLRDNLIAADLLINSWHGPGAISSVILKRNGIKNHMVESPPEVVPILQHAYAGGRPELLCGGYYDGPVYQYDFNSCYPAAIQLLPSLRGSRWTHHNRSIDPSEVDDWGIYQVTARTPFDAVHDAKPYPLFWRGSHGEVYYPKDVTGWYWGVEVKLLAEFQCYDEYQINEAWILGHQSVYPFTFIEGMYEQRREWKKQGNPANIAYKLGLNSMYGKQAQRIGAYRGGPPAWHQLEWSGWTTAYSRANLYRAMMQEPHALISCSTDSVFSTVPLDLPVSEKLGEWEYTEATGIVALQSGVYWLRDGSGEWKAKYRGFDKDTLSIDSAMDYLTQLSTEPRTARLYAESTRFGTWSQTRGSRKWRQWTTSPRELQFGSPLSKRGHYSGICPECQEGLSLVDALHTFHTCGLPWVGKLMSSPHNLPWSEYGDDSLFDYEEEELIAG